jgi:nitrogen fixation protein NifZ
VRISRDSTEVELDAPPAFEYGARVRACRTVRNDGTFVGKDIGDVLCQKGEEGYVMSIGTFLQQFYIYGVEFFGTGHRVGMKGRELERVERPVQK